LLKRDGVAADGVAGGEVVVGAAVGVEAAVEPRVSARCPDDAHADANVVESSVRTAVRQAAVAIMNTSGWLRLAWKLIPHFLLDVHRFGGSLANPPGSSR
jgi:hypothetical protein